MISFVRANGRWLFAGMNMTFATSFGQTFFISIFAAEIMQHYALSDGEWGALYALGTMVSGFVMIWAGTMTDVFRVRTLAVCLLAGIALCSVAMAFNSSAFLLPLIIFGLRFFGQGMLFHTAFIGMARWFSRNRGKAMSIAGLGFSVGEAFLPLLVVALLSFLAWETIWLIAAVLCVLFIPLIRRLLAEERQPRDLEDTEVTPGLGHRHWTRPEVVKNWVFWALFPLVIGPSTYGTILFFQQVHLSEVKGWTHASFVALFPIYTATTVVSMLLYGVLIDRFGAMRLIAAVQIPMAIGFGVLSLAETPGMAMIGLIFVALSHGGWSTTSTAFWAELYGTRHLGSIKSAATAIMVLGSALGPAVSGALIDRNISFPMQMPYFSVLILLACGLAGFSVYRARRRYT
ncbi:MAG: MFS transporter [Pseudomonadota bacterium]